MNGQKRRNDVHAFPGYAWATMAVDRTIEAVPTWHGAPSIRLNGYLRLLVFSFAMGFCKVYPFSFILYPP